MGIGSDLIATLIKLKKSNDLLEKKAICEIGAQQLSNSFLQSTNELNNLKKLFGIKDKLPFFEDQKNIEVKIAHGELEHLSAEAPSSYLFWKWMGYEYMSIDVDTHLDSLPLDLNYDSIPSEYKNQYSLVTNYGTTEHVANQLNAFKIIHDLCALGGVMIHSLPSQGYLNHGLVNYNPKFFWMLCRSNGYEVINFEYSEAQISYGLPENVMDFCKKYGFECKDLHKYIDTGLLVVLRKKYLADFISPLDVPTGVKSSNPIFLDRYPSIFKENYFINHPRHKQFNFLRNLNNFVKKFIYS